MTQSEKEAKVIELAELEVKRFCKKAIDEGYNATRVKAKIAEIVRKTLEHITTPQTRADVLEALPRLATEMLAMFSNIKRTLAAIDELAKQEGNEKVAKLLTDRSRLDENLMLIASNPEAYNVEPGARLYFREYHSQVRDTLDKIVRTGAYLQYDTRRVNLRNIAEMTVRYDSQLAMISELKESGEDLVWIEPHANCSERCQRWQGKLFSLSGRSGKIDGIEFQPLSNATDATTTSKSGRVWKNGCITGYNCRHKLLPYRGKNSRPVEIPAKVVAQQRKAEEVMRAMEREIRYFKEMAEFSKGIDDEKAKKAKTSASTLTRKYEAFSKKNKLAFVRERTRILKGENIYKRREGIPYIAP